tara:strand:- start:984 stop:1586 length:603 start_codon:yes stop_codon:yes gene_type:complete
MEVQAHGNYYEDLKTRQITGLSKVDYDALKENGYTSGMDIMKGLLSISDYSIKTAKGNRVDCGDVLRRRQEFDYNLVVGVYEQCGDNKVFHTEYTFYIRPEHERKLWGKMNYNQLAEYVTYIKNIPAGKQAQQETKTERMVLKNCISDNDALVKIHPKVDSKNQRRVQCSVKISELMNADIPYTKRLIRETVFSPSRQFN